ncbi:ATP-binding protein [Salinicola sp. CR57]|uniref:ATP-dependent nuclease n=1 Tax=Salinicola sp. CR57 TaxID=1949086 RepID=UPI000DA1CC94|nr:ATP-binding protein [Salinicola sp. CR57]
MKLFEIQVANFKRITSARVALGDITYLVGGNNSGKSSFLQAIHMAVMCGRKSLETKQAAIAESSLQYVPTGDFQFLGNSRPYENNREKGSRGKVVFFGETSDQNSASYTIEIYKARNYHNVGVDRRGVAINFGVNICDTQKLFSVYVPGLSGIPHHEEMLSYASVMKKAAGGEANLVFRNILRLLKEKNKLDELHLVLASILGECEYKVTFNEDRDLYVDVKVNLGAGFIPVDLAGTGAIQITQIIAYVILFEPKLLLIDEPDSHLHPSKQSQLDSVFKAIAENYGCKILISTHSRHLISSCSPESKLVWMKDGSPEAQENTELASILMDLGALDQIDANGADVLVCTEDKGAKPLGDSISNAIPGSSIKTISYNGIANASSSIIIERMAELLNNKPRLIIHRDRDFLVEDELHAWAEPFENRGMAIFCPRLCDIESYYCTPEHLSAVYEVEPELSRGIVRELLADNHTALYGKFREKRRDAVKKYWPDGGSPTTRDLWDENDGIQEDFIYGKKFLGVINEKFTAALRQRGVERSRLNVYSIPSERLKTEFEQFLATI